MATFNTNIAGAGYGSVYVDALVWGNAGWNVSTGPITWWLAGPGEATASDNPGTQTVMAWTDAERAAFREILQLYSSVSGLTFQEAANVQSANLIQWKVGNAAFGNDTTAGDHEVPMSGTHFGNPNSLFGRYNYEQLPSWDQNYKGGDGYQTLVHEIGHGLGLAHPHDGGDRPDLNVFPGVTGEQVMGDFNLNQSPYSTMSYVESFRSLFGSLATEAEYGRNGGLGPFDIAALQRMYGANMTNASGANVYEMPTANVRGTYWSTIWDAGGTDTLSNEASSTGSTMDLRGAPLVGPEAGGYASFNVGIQGGFLIANGVVIENAIGGSGADTITGNDAWNMVDGRGGADVIKLGIGNDVAFAGAGADQAYGGWGNDKLSGGAGDDTISGGMGDDFVFAGADNDVIYAGMGNDVVFAGSGADTVFGGAGNDTIWGGAGNDQLWGGLGADQFAFAAGSGADTISGFNQAEGDRLALQGQTYTTSNVGGNVVLALSGGGSITLEGVSNFVPNDFIA